jgi:hypothetical protein
VDLSWDIWIRSKDANPIPFRSILILSSHLHLGLASSTFPSGSLLKFCILSHTWCLSPPPHTVMLYFLAPILHGEGYEFWSSLVCIFLHPLDFRVSSILRLKHHQWYKTASKTLISFSSIFVFVKWNGGTKILNRMVTNNFRIYSFTESFYRMCLDVILSSFEGIRGISCYNCYAFPGQNVGLHRSS